LLQPGSARCGNGTSHTCSAGCVDEVSCRIFLCARCRSQSLICRRCDRGQIYCMGSCARDARREGQREARRRHQATPRGRAMHAERNRRYRARVRRVTDHGLAREHETAQWGGTGAVPAGLSEPSPGGRSPAHYRCHHCGRPASTFVRLVCLRPRGRRGERIQIRHRDPTAHRDRAGIDASANNPGQQSASLSGRNEPLLRPDLSVPKATGGAAVKEARRAPRSGAKRPGRP
jgi:hypothetical protein